MRALDRKILRDLVHLRGQMAAVAVVVACGIAMFVALRSMHGYLRGTLESYYAEYRFADAFATVERAPYSVLPRIREIPGVGAVQPRIVQEVVVDVPGLAEPATARLISLPDEGAPRLNRLQLRRGGLWSAGARDEVVVSDAFARANALAPGSELTAVVNGRWQRLRVVGTALSPEYVYEVREGDIFPDNRRFGVMWMSESSLAASFDLEGAFNDLALAYAPGARAPEVIDRVDRLLERYGGLGAYGREEQGSHQFVTSEIEETQVTSILIPGIFLAVTAFLLHIVLGRLVGTERDQIGTLKAFGYRDAEVGVHYLKLALVPVLVGAAVGIGVGIWFAAELARVYARFFQFPVHHYRQDWAIVAMALAIGGGAALAGAVSAVRRAVALPPAEAMRPEAPARFRPGLLERIGLQRLVSPGTRIVLRNLERQPVRSLLAVFGLSLAAAIVVTGLYLFDAIAAIRHVVFDVARQEDVTVVFRHPVDERVRHELARLPGVTDLEGFRAVPVRLRSGHLSSRTALLGMEADARLVRVVGGDLTVHPVPPEGVLLSATLADRLRVAPGDEVTVEVLEGRRPVWRVAVYGVADELVGSSAYMDFALLRRLLREEGTLSGAYLEVTSGEAPALYARLKGLPAVSGVGIRASVVEGFDRTIAESLRISIVMIIGFACAIAFGMVYNSARISLSERGRELASLRVLGYTRGEVARMLLGEQALLTLLSIPLGFALGYGLCLLVVLRFSSELFRLPLVVNPRSYALAALVMGVAAAASGYLVRRRLDRLDLIEVLKTRE